MYRIISSLSVIYTIMLTTNHQYEQLQMAEVYTNLLPLPSLLQDDQQWVFQNTKLNMF